MKFPKSNNVCITIKRLFIISGAAPGFACMAFINEVLLSLRI